MRLPLGFWLHVLDRPRLSPMQEFIGIVPIVVRISGVSPRFNVDLCPVPGLDVQMTAWGPGAPGICAVCPAAQSDVEPTTTLSLGDPYFF